MDKGQVWEGWLPRCAFSRVIARAKRRIAAAKREWGVVQGPATATAMRIRWEVVEGFNVPSDSGD